VAGGIAAVGHLLRFEPHYAAAYQRLQSGSVGEPLYALTWRESTRASAATYISRSTVPMHLMVHDIDLLRWFSGAKVSRIQAACPRVPERGTGTDGGEAVTAIFEFTNGMTALNSKYNTECGVRLLILWAVAPIVNRQMCGCCSIENWPVGIIRKLGGYAWTARVKTAACAAHAGYYTRRCGL